MADDRQDLLNAINEFLDCSIVIPPSEVEGKDLLKSIATFQKELLRKRKERDQKSTKEGHVQEAKGLFSLFLLHLVILLHALGRVGKGQHSPSASSVSAHRKHSAS